jgi:plastocyanin
MHPRLFAVLVTLTMGATACGGGSEPAPGSTPPAEQPAGGAPTASVDPATAATVAGKIALEGALPANQPIRMNADPSCAKANQGQNPTQETFVGEGGGLGNVFVYVASGLSGSFPAPTTPVVLDQKNCRYVPHLFGVQVGQPIEIVNSDPTLHNIHATPKTNAEFNTAQPIQGMKTTHTFTAKEADVVVPFKCDVHGWMNANVGVLDHPYFAVTKPDGSFSIPNLPPGTYTLAAWHERLGKQEQSITVAAKESKSDANFTFKAAAASGN